MHSTHPTRMLSPVSRLAAFQNSPIADQFIAEMQQSYAQGLNPDYGPDRAELKRLFDHREPLLPNRIVVDGHCIIAYPAAHLNDYIQSCSLVVQRFLQALSIQQLYLMDFVKTNLLDFPFENFRKRNQFKRMGSFKSNNMCYQLATAHLHLVLPVFYLARKWDVPLIFLLTAEGEVPISLRLCDDGNFHLNYHKKYDQQIRNAAQDAGLKTGNTTLCDQYSVVYFNRN